MSIVVTYYDEFGKRISTSEESAADFIGVKKQHNKFQVVSRNNGCRLVPALPGRPDLKSFRSTSVDELHATVSVNSSRGDLI